MSPCPEAIGFDLCDPCHLNAIADVDAADASVGDVIRGRFNQNHRPGHHMAAGSVQGHYARPLLSST